MKRRRAVDVVVAAFVGLTLLGFFAPAADAQAGTPATLDWEVTVWENDGIDEEIDLVRTPPIAVSSDSSLYVLITLIDAGGNREALMIKYDRAGSELWRVNLGGVCGHDQCGAQSLSIGHDRQVYAGIGEGAQVYAVRIRADDGTLDAQTVNLGELATNPIQTSLSDIDTTGASLDDLTIIASSSASDRIVRFSYDLQTVLQNIAATDVSLIKHPDFINGTIYSTRVTGGATQTDTWQTRDNDTLAVGTTSAHSRTGLGRDQMPYVLDTDHSTALGLIGATDRIRWKHLDSQTFAGATVVTPTNAQIGNANGAGNTQPFAMDPAGESTLLICGAYDDAVSGDDLSFISRYDTTFAGGSDGQDWNVTIDKSVAAGPQNARDCVFDHVNGFYVALVWWNANSEFSYGIQRYTGGGFEQPAARSFFVAEVEAEPGQPSEFDTGFKGFVAGVGFRTPESQMMVALILIGVTTVTAGSMTRFIGPGRLKNGMVAGAAMGVGVFAAVLFGIDLWMTVLGVVLGSFVIQGSKEARNTFRELREEARAFVSSARSDSPKPGGSSAGAPPAAASPVAPATALQGPSAREDREASEASGPGTRAEDVFLGFLPDDDVAMKPRRGRREDPDTFVGPAKPRREPTGGES